MKRYTVSLSSGKKEELTELTSKGKHRSQKILNSLILLSCDKGKSHKKPSINEEISHVLNVSMKKIDRVKKGLLKKVSMSR